MTASQWCLKIFCTQSFDEELATIINHDFRTATSLHPPARLGSAKLLPPNLAARPIGRREQLFARSARSGQRHHQPRRQDLLGARGPNSGHFESPETEAVIDLIPVFYPLRLALCGVRRPVTLPANSARQSPLASRDDRAGAGRWYGDAVDGCSSRSPAGGSFGCS